MAQAVSLSQIKIDGGTQCREVLDEGAIGEYAERMASGDQPPPIKLFFDGSTYWLADGFHRFHAARKAQLASLPADVETGTRREAILYAVGANSEHGVRRSNADKRKAVALMLADAEWASWSNSEIGRRCVVSHKFVGNVRESLCTVQSEPRTYTNKHGTTSTMRTENIGRRPQPEAKSPIASPKPSQPIETRQSLGVGLAYAHKAISFLQQIPTDDGLRDEAFDTVARWISDNR